MPRKPYKETGLPLSGFCSAFYHSIELAASETSVQAAEEMVNRVKEVIDRQRYNWKPLSRKYLKRKKRLRLDHRIYLQTNFFYDHIGVRVTGKGRKQRVHFGVPNIPWKPRGKWSFLWKRRKKIPTLHQINRWMEYGTRRMPSRPLFRPVLSAYMRRHGKFAHIYRTRVKNEMRKRKKMRQYLEAKSLVESSFRR